MKAQRRFGVLVLAMISVVGCELSEVQLGAESQPIIGGELDRADPAVAALVRTYPGGASSLCTATLIASDTLLAATHCVTGDRSPNQHYAYFGTELSKGDPDYLADIDVVDVAYDARFREDQAYLGHDIAIIRLAESAPVTPIPLETRAGTELYGDAIRIVGFGQTSFGSDVGVKYQATATVHDPVDVIGESTSSVLLYGDSDTTVCQGDSGGPGLTHNGTQEVLAAVTSFTTGECEGFAGGAPVAQFTAELVEPFLDRGSAAFCGEDGICGTSCSDDPDCAGDICVSDGSCYAPCGTSDPDCVTDTTEGDNSGDTNGDGSGNGDTGSDTAGSKGGCSSAPSRAPFELGIVLLGLALALARRRRWCASSAQDTTR